MQKERQRFEKEAGNFLKVAQSNNEALIELVTLKDELN